MNKLWKKLNTIELSAKAFWLVAAAFAVLRLLMLSQQSMTLYPESSMLDDMLMIKASQNVLAGEWLGSYNYLTIGKHMLFAVWLAIVSKLGISYLLAGQLLYTAASFALVQSLAPAMKSRLWRLAFLVYLLFNPAAYADFTLRVYRDNITVSFVMLVFAGFIGLALRYLDEKTAPMYGWGLLGGFALGCSFLLREDGWWLAPLCIVAAVTVVVLLLRAKPKKLFVRLGSLLVCFAVAAGCIAAYCGMNQKHYGRFIVSDLTSSEFQAAYGAMTRVVAEDEDYNPIVPIPRSSREKLYAVSPLFAELEPYLESNSFSRWQKDCGNGELEYSGGGFYWAVRNAASLLGYYETPETARQFYIDLADELNAACDSGAFEALGERSGLNSPITAGRILPTLKEAVRSLYTVVTYDKISNSPELSVGEALQMDEIERIMHAEAMRTDHTPNGDTRVIVWAFGENGGISLALYDGDEPVKTAFGYGTGSDIYLDKLYSGTDYQYTNACRYTLTFAGEPTDTMNLQITDPDSTVVSVPLKTTETAETQGPLHWQIESIEPDYTESVSYGFVEIWLYRLMRVVVFGYRILNTLFFVWAVFLFLRTLLRCIKKRAFCDRISLLLIVAFGLLMMAALRIGMVSFAEVSAFGIGTYPMYLAAVYPLLIAFQFLCGSLDKTVTELCTPNKQ